MPGSGRRGMIVERASTMTQGAASSDDDEKGDRHPRPPPPLHFPPISTITDFSTANNTLCTWKYLLENKGRQGRMGQSSEERKHPGIHKMQTEDAPDGGDRQAEEGEGIVQ